MKTSSRLEGAQNETAEKSFAIDTSFVLFFLAIEFGHTISVLSVENVLLFLTLLMVVVLPYFLASGEKPVFRNWLFGRVLIAGFAVLLGLLFKQSLGVVLPDEFRFLPMTLLIVAAMLSCYIQFYGFLKLRLVK